MRDERKKEKGVPPHRSSTPTLWSPPSRSARAVVSARSKTFESAPERRSEKMPRARQGGDDEVSEGEKVACEKNEKEEKTLADDEGTTKPHPPRSGLRPIPCTKWCESSRWALNGLGASAERSAAAERQDAEMQVPERRQGAQLWSVLPRSPGARGKNSCAISPERLRG